MDCHSLVFRLVMNTAYPRKFKTTYMTSTLLKLAAYCFFILANLKGFANEPVNSENAFNIPRSEVFDLEDPTTKRIYPIFVKVPRSYINSGQRKYPVIYVIDALYAFQVISGATRFPMNTNVIEEAIIVGISYAKADIGVTSRVRDYTPFEDAGWRVETGQAEQHHHFIKNTVISKIEKRFRAKSSDRTLVGNSLGGLFSAYILMKHPETFDNYIIGSPSVWFKDNQILAQLINPLSLEDKKAYISVGKLETPEYGEQEDMVSGAKALYQKLRNQMPDSNIKLALIPEANHGTAFPTTSIQGLYWLNKVAGKND